LVAGFCRRVSRHGLAIEFQLPGNPALGPALCEKGDDRLLDAHVELVHCTSRRSDLRRRRKLPSQSGWF
jgi:hypothetical protein